MKTYPDYKDSGNEWIGQIPSHWEMLRNKVFIHEIDNKVGKSTSYKLLSLTKQGVIERDVESGKGKFPKDFENYKIVTPGNMVFCLFDVDETPRTVGLSSLTGMITGAYNIYEISNISPKFYLYLFTAIDDAKALKPLYSGLRKVVKSDRFSAMRIPVPTKAEQEKIAEYLDAKTLKIDDCICLRERELQTLNELKQAEIASVVTRGLNPDVPMKDSGIPWIGQIPAHWDIKRLGTRFHSRTEVNSDLEFLKAFKFNYGSIVPKDEVGFPEEYAETYVKYTKVTTNDIMINGLNLNYDFVSQRVAIVPAPGIITSAYLVLRPYPYTYSPYFCYLFKAMDSMKLFHGMGTGIRLTLSFRELKKQLIPIPPEKEQKEIVAFIEKKLSKIDTLIDSLNAEIERLKEYKQRLISDVVTGQINVQDETI